ncbi:MAG: DUF3516 domain-containing protein, partial [Archangium sp.]|nr:DUF3516 domain-containing protein [Archangium sp.]
SIPDAAKNEALDDIAGYLLATLRHTDSSLLEEWEALRTGGPLTVQATEAPRPKKKDLAADPKALAARARAELHQFVRLLARKQWDAAVEQLMPDTRWTAAELEKTLAPYFTEFPALDTTPRARQPVLTQLVPDGARKWTVRHTLLDGEGEPSWFIDGEIDLVDTLDVEGALVVVRHIGP